MEASSSPVNPDVGLQRALGREALSADLAGEWLLTCQKHERHSSPLQERATQTVGFLRTCVSPQVLLQLSCVHELVMTQIAFW